MILHMVLVAAGQETRMASDSPGQLQRAFDATASLQAKNTEYADEPRWLHFLTRLVRVSSDGLQSEARIQAIVLRRCIDAPDEAWLHRRGACAESVDAMQRLARALTPKRPASQDGEEANMG